MKIPARPTQPQQPNTAVKKFTISTGIMKAGWKIGIYGPEGIGKSSLAALCPGATFADIEMSMKDMEVPKVQGVESWKDLRDWVQSLNSGIAGIDTMSRAEDWAAQFVIKNKQSNEGKKAVDSLEDFKYRAGSRFVNDEFKKLFTDIDAATRRGVCFIMIAHNRVKKFTDPDGANFVRFEPMLMDTDEVSNMRQWVQFLDHCAFVDLDRSAERGKVKSNNTRSIYLDTSASHISKCRGIDNTTIDFQPGSVELWQRLGAVK
jgi:hypothetical protein